jgi:uncharacterized protein YcaQ
MNRNRMRGTARPLSIAAVRRLAVVSQGFATGSSGDARSLLGALRALSCVQLDSISAVERSHRIVLASRAGPYPKDAEWALLQKGKAFEYWAHEACLLPMEDFPLFRFRMRERRVHHWFGPVIDSDPVLAERVLATIRERGPLGSRDFEGKGGGGMWNWKPAKRMLDALWTAGDLVIAGRRGFQRLYELPERLIPARILEAKIPSEEEHLRGLALRAVKARGVLTAAGILEHYRIGGGVARIKPHLDALVERGELRRLELEDGKAPVFVARRARLDPEPPDVAVLLSPFDNLLWDRDFAVRLFRFDHLIEVYKPQPQRRFGYYVLPLLVGDELVGRADLKSERASGALRIKAFHREAHVRRSARLDDRLDAAAAQLASNIGLERVLRR